jgi:hypothetical protein
MKTDSLRLCFTVNEAAEYLRISRALLYQLIRQVGSRPLRLVRALSFEAPSSNVFSTSSKQRRSVSRLQQCHRGGALEVALDCVDRRRSREMFYLNDQLKRHAAVNHVTRRRDQTTLNQGAQGSSPCAPNTKLVT